MRKISTITEDQLLENGWTKTNDVVFPYKKDITQRSEEGGYVKLVVHGLYNTSMFALSITDGYLININPASIEELNAFEKLILSVDTPY